MPRGALPPLLHGSARRTTGSRLHGRLAQAPGLGGLCLVCARPGRTGIAEEAQLAIRGGLELKSPTGRDDDSVARAHLDRLGPSAGRAAPHLTAPSDDVPDLLHRAVGDGPRHSPGPETHLAKTGARGAMGLGGEEAYLGAVGSDCVGLSRGPAWRRRRGHGRVSVML